MPKQAPSRSWLYSWGGNFSLSLDALGDSAEMDSETQTGTNNKEIPDTNDETVGNNVVVSSLSQTRTPETCMKPDMASLLCAIAPPIATSHLPSDGSKRQQTSSPSQTQTQMLKSKPSVASLGAYSPSNWLGWNTKNTRSNSLPEEKAGTTRFRDSESSDNQKATHIESNDAAGLVEDAVAESEVSGANDGGINVRQNAVSASSGLSTEPNGDPETASSHVDLAPHNDTSNESHRRKKSWGFWNSADDTGSRKDGLLHAKITNTILKSTPSIPSKQDIRRLSSESLSEPDEETRPSSKEGVQKLKTQDAVLYKPHHSAREFNKINRHKNENLWENTLVPNWQTCLKLQDSASYASTALDIQAISALKPGPTFDIKYWKNYLSNISSRLGLKSSSETSIDSRDENSQLSNKAIFTSNTEADLHLLRERSYKLYGRSLARLPPHKRACLPNPNHFYTAQKQHRNSSTASQALAEVEGGESSQNPVSITNDALGNLLINHKDIQKQASSVLSKKVGPLRKINKILIIGVHGFFPTRMIRPIIGSPKGTSSKFANEAEKAVIRYLVDNDMMSENESNGVSIQKIALEKEGKIFDRVGFFLSVLTRWEKELNEADFIFIAAHSQGCVVSIILLALLIKKNILKRANEKRVGILGMAGINNGPFYGVDKSLFMKAYSAIEHDSMTELFELTKFDSPQSVAYKDAMQTIISMNVKICLVGSINDQLVPLYSALASHVFHPNIYRACYIDSSAKTPAFIKTLISLCCQLQNTGYFDNNVIKEISPILAGPLTGGGHSKIYNDGKVYDLGIQFMLDTDDLVIPGDAYSGDNDTELPITNKVYVKEYNVGKIGTNPFILPWCLRGLIFNVQKNWRKDDTLITTQNGVVYRTGEEEIHALYALFDQWRPETKALKDLKFRLNGIRASKL